MLKLPCPAYFAGAHAANLIPEIRALPAPVRELRQLLSQRRQLVETDTHILNQMHSVVHRHHLQHERGKRFTEKNTRTGRTNTAAIK